MVHTHVHGLDTPCASPPSDGAGQMALPAIGSPSDEHVLDPLYETPVGETGELLAGEVSFQVLLELFENGVVAQLADL